MGHILVTGIEPGNRQGGHWPRWPRAGAGVIGHSSGGTSRPQAEQDSAIPIIAADFGDPLSVQSLWEQALALAGGGN